MEHYTNISLIVLSGVGLRMNGVSNVIIRNLTIKKVLASAGDAIGIQASKNVWVDHCDLSSDRDHDKVSYQLPGINSDLINS